jgi:hypothetical protein
MTFGRALLLIRLAESSDPICSAISVGWMTALASANGRTQAELDQRGFNLNQG